MKLQVRQVEYRDVEGLRELYHAEASCQIRYDSMLLRGLADPFLLILSERTVGYGAVLNQYDRGTLIEFYVLPSARSQASSLFRELLQVSQATQIAAQTNILLLLTMLYDYAENIADSSILFHDAFLTNHACANVAFRRTVPEDAAKMFEHRTEPVGDWVVEAQDSIVATGGYYCHYNPPYGDIFMEVQESSRQKGIGTYLVQEVKRVCYESGKRPAARCDPRNIASRRTLEKAGFLPCARLLIGSVRPHI